MKKPAAIEQLIEELQGENPASSVDVNAHSFAILYPDVAAAKKEDGIELTAAECRLLFANSATVERLAEAINNKSASLVLNDLELSAEVLEDLESSFLTVDEF